jgi:hypothetical protein
VNLKLDFFLRQRWHAAGRWRAARGRQPLLRSVLRLIANMTFKLFLHCLVCELEVQFEFFCCAIFFCGAAAARLRRPGPWRQQPATARRQPGYITCDITK